MRQYVLTRAAYGAAWSLEANRQRLDVTRAVTARLMAAQTGAWTWIVLLDPTDPLLAERRALFESSAPACIPIIWQPPEEPLGAPWDRHARTATYVQRVAASAYRAPWREAIGPRDERILLTRLDDDDGLAPDALARYRGAAVRAKGRTVLMLPRGVRVFGGRYDDVMHRRNAMHTLVTPPGDATCVYDYGHTFCNRIGPVRMVDLRWGWLWVRIRPGMNLSGAHRAKTTIDRAVRDAFPIDWAALREAWA